MNGVLACLILLLSLAPFALGISVWWPVRKTSCLNSLPWILAYLLLGKLISLTGTNAPFVKVLNELHVSGRSVLAYDWTVIIISQVQNLIIILMLCINAAFLLHRNEGENSPFLVRLARWQAKQYILGILLLVLSFSYEAIIIGTIWRHSAG